MLSTVGIRVLWCSWCQFRWRYRCGVLAHAWGCTATTARLVFEGVAFSAGGGRWVWACRVHRRLVHGGGRSARSLALGR
jgi:hypothetical protein